MKLTVGYKLTDTLGRPMLVVSALWLPNLSAANDA